MNNLRLDGLELMIKRTKASLKSVDREIEVCQSLLPDTPTEEELGILIAQKTKKYKLVQHLSALEEKYNQIPISL